MVNDPKARLTALQEQLARDPASPAYLEYAETLIALGRYAEAAAACERGLSRRPAPEGRILLAEASLLLGRLGPARDAAERALLERPDDPRGLRVLAECHLALARPDLAEPLLERSARLDHSDMRTLDLLARCGEASAVASAGAGVPPPEPGPGAAPWDSEEEAFSPAARGPRAGSRWSFDDGLLDEAPGASGPEAPEADPFGVLDLEPAPPDGPAPADAAVPSPPPPAETADEESLELDLDRVPEPPPPPRPPSPPRPHGAPRATPLPRPARSATADEATPLAGGRSRRRLVLAGAAAAGVLVLVVGGLWLRASMRASEVKEDLAAARSALAAYTFAGYRQADVHVSAALALDPDSPDALGLGAFVAARLATDFDGGTEARVVAEERLESAERLPEVPPLAIAARGLLDLSDGRPGDVAVRVTRDLAARDPTLRWVRALCESRLERMDLALSTLEALRREAPAFLPAADSLAELERAGGHARKAAEIYRAVLDAHPEHVPALIGLVELGRGDPEATLARLDAAGEDPMTQASPTELCRLNLAAARLAVLAGRPERATAAEDLARTVVAAPGCKAALGRHLAGRHRLAEASDQLAAAADGFSGRDPDRAAALRLEAVRAALGAGRTGRALELLGQVPSDAAAAALAARAQLLDRDPDAARRTLAPLLRTRGRDAELLSAAAEVALARSDEGDARSLARRAAGAARDPVERADAARALLAVGDGRGAARLLRRTLPKRGPRGYDLLTLAGGVLAVSGTPGEGRALLEEAIRTNPDADPAVEAYLAALPGPESRDFLARLPAPYGPTLEAEADLSAGEVQAAQDALARAEAAGASGARLEITKARLALERGEEGALAALESAAKRFGERPSAHLALADGLLRLGRVGDAAQAYTDALRRDPGLVRARVGLAEAQASGAAANPGEAARLTAQAVTWVTRHGASKRLAARAHAAAARACAAAADLGCARRESAAARRLAPDAPEVLLAEGYVLAESGRFRDAAARYRSAADLPGGEDGLLAFGLLAAEDRVPRTGAAEALERFLTRLPRHARAPQARQALESLK